MRRLWLSFALLSLPAFPQQQPPQPVQRTDPKYSDEALIAGLEGTVEVAAMVSADGSLRDLRVTQPLGLGLDEKALDAVAQWRYEPAPPQPAPVSVPVDFNLPSKFSRWHLIGAKFDAPQGVSRPVFVRASYPLGAGISPNAYEEGRLLGAIGRPANVTLAFEIDDHGKPDRFEVVKASYDVWGFEAANLVAGWQFSPGTKEGLPVPVRCTVDLVWGAERLSTATIAQQLDALHPPPVPASVTGMPLPAVIRQVEPVYTEQARAAGLEGVVRVALVVGDDGTPGNLRVVQPDQPLGLGLDEQALQAISQWRFEPTLVNGQPTKFPEVIKVTFELRGVSTEPSFPPKAVPAKK
jgi:TonB family protein